MEIGYIYLLSIYPHNENIYKIGKTKNFEKRLQNYKNTRPIVHFVSSCEDITKYETELLRIFRSKFVSKKEIGSEFFYGNLSLMKKQIYNYFCGKIIQETITLPQPLKNKTMYKCNGCGYETKRKSNIISHLSNRLNPCSEFDVKDINDKYIRIKEKLEESVICNKCNKEFFNKYNKIRHERNCNKII
jgi:formylmethanofuran dehydrogenase subunit E